MRSVRVARISRDAFKEVLLSEAAGKEPGVWKKTDVSVKTGRSRISFNLLGEESRVPFSQMSSQFPFFVVGCPRSGTTFLQVLLNRHPHAWVPPELKLFFLYHGCPRWVRRKTLRRIESDCSVAFPADMLRGDRRVDEIYAYLHRLYPSHGIDRNRVSTTDVGHAPQRQCLLGDKTPEYSYRLDWIDEVFPDSRWIFVVRDPRDVALSLTGVPWLRTSVRGAALLWDRTQRRLLDAAERWPRRICWVRFERLVTRPEQELADALTFLGLSADESILSTLQRPSVHDASCFPERERAWKQTALNPPDLARVSAWRRNRAAIAEPVERVCGQTMDRIGYDRVATNGGGCSMTDLIAANASLARSLIGLPPAVWCSEMAYRLRDGRGIFNRSALINRSVSQACSS